jgi:hypothetical protein
LRHPGEQGEDNYRLPVAHDRTLRVIDDGL